jgi:pimeloyl-ACP methyl ester carboxylesterase
MAQIALSQATIDYRVVGPQNSAHPPILFVHGVVVDQRLWAAVPDQLAAQGFRCIVPTWPLGSHTTPANPGADLSPRGLAAMIDEFMAALNLTDVTLVGNDTGTGLCQFVIDAHPGRIGRLVLTNGEAFDTFPPFPFTIVFALLRYPSLITAMATPLRLRLFRHSPLAYGLLANTLDPKLTDSWFQPCRNDRRIRNDLAAVMKGIVATDLTDAATRFGRFTKPVTLVWGARDRCFTPTLAKRLAAQFPNSATIEVPEARTFIPLDNPPALINAIAAAEQPA